MANHSLSHLLLLPLAGDCSDEEPASSSAPVTFPSFWPPFPSFLSDSDSDDPFPLGHIDRCATAQQETAAAFLGLDFHEEVDEGGVEWAVPDDVGLPLCWDCLQLEEHEGHPRWDGLGLSDADEWEQVAGRGQDEAEAAAVRSLEWEVLLAANRLGSLVIDDDDTGGVDTYFLDDADDEEDMLFGQLLAAAEHERRAEEHEHERRSTSTSGLGAKGGRAAAKAAVEGLPTVVVAEADTARGGAAQCAVCKEGIEAGEGARRLPCAHLYHDGCILPWLAIRNTCPLCRHELPTDDADYEKLKARRAGAGDRYGIVTSQAEATLLNE